MTDPVRFDVLGPLPSGTTLLEASAGTGKTYTIAALATRYIAEGVTTIDRLLMITFGRKATRELRERVRAALTRARDALRTGVQSDDEVIRYLQGLPATERQTAADRLARAVADFDAGTIATTHTFCSKTLGGLGIGADTDPGEQFVENIGDLIDEVVVDFYVRKYGGPDEDPDRLSFDSALKIAREAVGKPLASLDAGPVLEGSVQATRVALARNVRAEVIRRRRRGRWETFDDLVSRLADALTDPVTGEQSCQRLRDSYEVVLVDEFQDTDPLQWTILRAAFHETRTLVLIGDPKQAIYAFRGADVFSYLEAAKAAHHHATLPMNWRSDEAVVKGVEAIMGRMQLGDERIVVRPVDAQHKQSRLTGVPEQARVRLRTFHADKGKAPKISDQRAYVADDVAADIVATLRGPKRLTTPQGGSRPVVPGDIAVLVARNEDGANVRDTLLAAGVPAVVATSASVFSTSAARDWLSLLRAMQRPRGSTLRGAALTCFGGYTPEDLATRGEAVDDALSQRLREWALVLERGSVAELVATMEHGFGIAAKVLAHPNGERDLTDLRHVAGLLHTQQRQTRCGLTGLVDWLDEQVRDAAKESSSEAAGDRTRRLDSDANAVQVRTIHVSKGLEFPIVYVPFSWSRFIPRAVDTMLCHDADGRCVLDVRGGDAIDQDAIHAAWRTEEAGESLRLLYVALTRASSELIVHWAPNTSNTPVSPLHRVLNAQRDGQVAPELSYPVKAPPALDSPWVQVEAVDAVVPAQPWQPPAADLPELQAAAFTRRVDTTWRRTSYSGLTREMHITEQRPGGFRDDEPDEIGEETEVIEATEGLESPFADMPAGAAFGTLVHHVLESVRTPADLADRCREQVAAFPVAGVEPERLTHELQQVMQTPLGPLAADLTLADLQPSDRLPELDFELPMGADGASTLADLAHLLRRHLPADDPLAAYADRLDTPGLAEAKLVGYLAGSIDAVLRIPGETPRFLVVDYKTNLLRDPSRPGVERLVDGYGPERMAGAMMDAHYPLQALLYTAALHRYLRWRLADYSPDRHLGGVQYLFLRGMAGPRTPAGCGVFSWRPPTALVVALSDLLDGRQP
ncbi:MAG: UvrD-helicase domain-containing protein [Candidatus Nanopelagicales bacterium]|nr:UvrD-helicase domain-containing protein [Candidatus Nanopelagicales bacterium]